MDARVVLCFVAPGCGVALQSRRQSVSARPPTPPPWLQHRPRGRSIRAGLRAAGDDDSADAMRSRLEGLFGGSDDVERGQDGRPFDGAQLRKLIKERFTVEYDVQPVVRHGRVYLHIMWRYYEQLSFYMDEEQWSQHMEAIADLLKKWEAVDYFQDYIRSVKKKRTYGFEKSILACGVSKLESISSHFCSIVLR
jgi:Domain of unknown function (DUF3067)